MPTPSWRDTRTLDQFFIMGRNMWPDLKDLRTLPYRRDLVPDRRGGGRGGRGVGAPEGGEEILPVARASTRAEREQGAGGVRAGEEETTSASGTMPAWPPSSPNAA